MNKRHIRNAFSVLLFIGIVLLSRFVISVRKVDPTRTTLRTPVNSNNHIFTVANKIHTSNNTGNKNLTAKVAPGVFGLCQEPPPGLQGLFAPKLDIVDWDTQEKRHPELTPGGFWKPPGCRARHRVAILIPFRKRDEHLHIFTNTMHDFLQKQLIEYAIYIIEQAGDAPFNRALLFNIGYMEAMKDQDWQCLVFHDVDNIPVNDKNLYTCPKNPRHMSVGVERFGYKLPYKGYFGGVTMMSTDHFKLINGMSNVYWGWGGEDDDLMTRVRRKKLGLLRYGLQIGRYKTLSKHHTQGKRNQVRGALLGKAAKRQDTDGIGNLQYGIIRKEYRKLFTYILADVNTMEQNYKARKF